MGLPRARSPNRRTRGELLAEALTGNKRLTRSQAAALFTAEGIDASGQRLYHLLWHSSQVGITCIGPTVDKEQTFVLLSDWAPDQRQLEGEEALAELAWSYFPELMGQPSLPTSPGGPGSQSRPPERQ